MRPTAEDVHRQMRDAVKEYFMVSDRAVDPEEFFYPSDAPAVPCHPPTAGSAAPWEEWLQVAPLQQCSWLLPPRPGPSPMQGRSVHAGLHGRSAAAAIGLHTMHLYCARDRGCITAVSVVLLL